MAVVTEREVAEAQRRRHRLTPSWPRARRPRAARSRSRRSPTAPPPTCAGSTAKPTPADGPGPGDHGGDGAGSGRAWAWQPFAGPAVDIGRICYNITLPDDVQPDPRERSRVIG